MRSSTPPCASRKSNCSLRRSLLPNTKWKINIIIIIIIIPFPCLRSSACVHDHGTSSGPPLCSHSPITWDNICRPSGQGACCQSRKYGKTTTAYAKIRPQRPPPCCSPLNRTHHFITVFTCLTSLVGLGIARYLTIQFDSLGVHSIRYRFNNTCRWQK